MPALLNISGHRFGRLLAVRLVEIRKWERLWLCKCDCGASPVIGIRNLRRGAARSCGCLKKEIASAGIALRSLRHGHSGRQNTTAEYVAWQNLKKRCFDPRTVGFKHYGGRGITVCDRWKNSFESFVADMGRKPSSRHTIDRIDTNGNYEPSNCRWATWHQQRANQRPYPSGEQWKKNNGDRMRDTLGRFLRKQIDAAVQSELADTIKAGR